MTRMTVQRLVAALLACVLGSTLGACVAASDFVADSWPHFAGGEPNDLPPRPGSPGYAAFIAHGQAVKNAQTPPGGVTPQFAARQPAGGGQQAPAGTTATAPAQDPASRAPTPNVPDQNVGQGGLY
jgi:hypothetical protein